MVLLIEFLRVDVESLRSETEFLCSGFLSVMLCSCVVKYLKYVHSLGTKSVKKESHVHCQAWNSKCFHYKIATVFFSEQYLHQFAMIENSD